MKINEIIVDHDAVLFETIINSFAKAVYDLYTDIQRETQDFAVSPYDIYSLDDRESLITIVKQYRQIAMEAFNETHQTPKLVHALLMFLYE